MRCQKSGHAVKLGGTCLINNVEVISEGCGGHHSEVILQDLDECLYERKRKQRIDCARALARSNATTKVSTYHPR